MVSLFLSLLLVTAGLAAKNTTDHIHDYDVLQYIDPLIGSANGGKQQRCQLHDT